MKKFIIILTVFMLTLVPVNSVLAKSDNKDVRLVKQYCQKHYASKKYKRVFIKEQYLNTKKLKTRKRNKTIYIEVIKSVSKGKYGITRKGNYIRYNCKVKKGKKVKSYLIYNPKTRNVDDVVAVVDNGKIR